MKTTATVFSLIAVFVILALASISFGTSDLNIYKIFFGNLSEVDSTILYDIRLPRLVAGIFVGVCLSTAGVAMQSLFRNPLADPSITGVSSGSALGAVIAIAFIGTLSNFSVQVFALIFGLISAFAIWKLGRIDGRVSAFAMLLAGIAVNAMCGAIVGFMMYSVRETGLKGFIFWSLGSLENCGWIELFYASILAIPAWIFLFINAKALNLLSLGKDEAFHCGINADRLQKITMTSAALLTAASVSISGVIGFVGLVIPHVVRILVGTDNRKLIPISSIAGASLIIFSDSISRAISPTDNVPIGVITALIGAPFFIFLLKTSKNV